MIDLTLISKRHQRYENGIAVQETQYCGRAVTIENKRFSEILGGMDVSPSDGFLVRMFNTLVSR